MLVWTGLLLEAHDPAYRAAVHMVRRADRERVSAPLLLRGAPDSPDMRAVWRGLQADDAKGAAAGKKPAAGPNACTKACAKVAELAKKAIAACSKLVAGRPKTGGKAGARGKAKTPGKRSMV